MARPARKSTSSGVARTGGSHLPRLLRKPCSGGGGAGGSGDADAEAAAGGGAAAGTSRLAAIRSLIR